MRSINVSTYHFTLASTWRGSTKFSPKAVSHQGQLSATPIPNHQYTGSFIRNAQSRQRSSHSRLLTSQLMMSPICSSSLQMLLQWTPRNAPSISWRWTSYRLRVWKTAIKNRRTLEYPKIWQKSSKFLTQIEGLTRNEKSKRSKNRAIWATKGLRHYQWRHSK